jgi:hypothetical protein
MDDESKPPKKKRSKKEKEPAEPMPTIDALASLTSSDVIRQVKEGLSRIAPLELEGEDEASIPEEPPY